MNRDYGKLVQDNLRAWDNYHCPLTTVEYKRYVELSGGDKPGRMLDIGCADGGLSSYFIELGWKSFGVDISASNVLSAKENGVECVLSLLQEPLPFSKDNFDLVVAKEVIEHVLDTRFLLKECIRVLRPGGIFILSTPNLASLSNRIRLLFGRYPGWMDYELGQGAGHVRYYTLSILRDQITAVGYQVEKEVGTELALPILGRYLKENRSKILGFVGKNMPELSPVLIIRARKPY